MSEDEQRRQQAAEEDDRHRRSVAAQDKIFEIYDLAVGDVPIAVRRSLRNQRISYLQAARAKYVEIFRRPHGDPNIDIEIQNAFEHWMSEPAPLVVRPDLILALLLREGFAGRGRGERISPFERIANRNAIDRYKARRKEIKAELIAQDREPAFAARAAEDRAAQEISELSGLPKTQISGRRPNRRRRRRLPGPIRDLSPDRSSG